MADEIVIGKIGLTPKGEYVPGELYDILDMVSHEGNSYVSKIQNNIVDVINTEAWLLVAEKGEAGLSIKGDKGDTFTFNDLTTEQKEELKGDVIIYNSMTEAEKDDFASRVPITGEVEQGNTQAVSGGEVFKKTIKNSDLDFRLPVKFIFNQSTNLTETGVTFQLNARVTTDFIPVIDTEDIYIERGNAAVSVAFYDENKSYIGYFTGVEGDSYITPVVGAKFAKTNISLSLDTRIADVLKFKIYQKGNPNAKINSIANAEFVDLEFDNDNLYDLSTVVEDCYVYNDGSIGSGASTPITSFAMAIIPLVDKTQTEISFIRANSSTTVGLFCDEDGNVLDVITGGATSGTLNIPAGSDYFIINISNNPTTRETDIRNVGVAYGNEVPEIGKKILKINGYDLAFPESTSNQKRIYPTIELGGINSQGVFNGVWYNKQYQVTVNYIDFSLNSSFIPKTSIECECRVSWYDENYEHTRTTDFYPTNGISFARNENEIYGKLMFRKSENLEDLPTFDFYIDGIFTENWDIKNVRNADGYQRLAIPVNVANVNSTDLKTNDVQDLENILPDYGLLALPENYRNTGEPTRLIIYCHGAGVNYADNVSVFPASDIRPEYWLSEGYAVMDIEGNPFDNTNEHFYIPQAIQSYISAYEWVLKAYNIKTDGIFLGGRSMGGGMVFDILQSRIPVIAACPLVPVANTLLAWNYMNQARRTFTANHLGITDVTWTASNPMTISEWDGLKNNFDKLVKYSPMWRGIESLPDKDILFSVGRINSSTQFNQEEYDLYSTLHFKVKAPIKLFGVEDDATVPHQRNSELMYKMLVNGGNICELRTFTTGGHHFEIDNPDCLTDWTNSRGQLLEDVPVVYIEMLQFWRRYE